MKLGGDTIKLNLGSQEVRKAYLGAELVYDNDLPYTSEVEYLEATGNDTWINTGFAPTSNDVCVIVDAMRVGSGDYILYSINGTNPRLSMNWYNAANAYFRYRDYNSQFNFATGRHTFENGVIKKIDDVTVASPSYSPSVTFEGNTKKIALFGFANAAEPTAVNYAFVGRIYEFKIYESNILKLHFIPVRVGTTGYMYDKVSGQLFGNSGTGIFNYGGDV